MTTRIVSARMNPPFYIGIWMFFINGLKASYSRQVYFKYGEKGDYKENDLSMTIIWTSIPLIKNIIKSTAIAIIFMDLDTDMVYGIWYLSKRCFLDNTILLNNLTT